MIWPEKMATLGELTSTIVHQIQIPFSFTMCTKSRCIRYLYIRGYEMESVKSIHLCKSLTLTSYDIVKVLGGEIKVGTQEGEGSVFAIQLPFVRITD